MASWEERFDATCDEIMELLRNRLVTRTATTEIFDGKEVKPWIHLVESHFLRLNLSDEQKLGTIRTCIKGEAKDFVRRQELFSPFRSWNEMKNELVIRFGNEDDPDKIRLLRDRRLQDFLDNYDARKLREKRDTEVNISHSEPCRSSRSEGYGVVKVADQGNLVHVFSMPERLLTNDCLPEANQATEVMLHNELLPASDHEECLGGEDEQREAETLVPTAHADLITDHVGGSLQIRLIGSEPPSMGCEELFGWTNTTQKNAQEQNLDALSERDVNDCVYQVFDPMPLGGKLVTKRRKRKRWKENVKMKITPRGKRPRLRKLVRKYGDHSGSLRETKMGNGRKVIKRILKLATMLQGRKRVLKKLAKWMKHRFKQKLTLRERIKLEDLVLLLEVSFTRSKGWKYKAAKPNSETNSQRTSQSFTRFRSLGFAKLLKGHKRVLKKLDMWKKRKGKQKHSVKAWLIRTNTSGWPRTAGFRKVDSYEELGQRIHRNIDELQGGRRGSVRPRSHERRMVIVPTKRKSDSGSEESNVAENKSVEGKLDVEEAAKDLTFGYVKIDEDEKDNKTWGLSKAKELGRALTLAAAKKDPAKGQVIANKHSWQEVSSSAAGLKVHDDPKLLKQSIHKAKKKHEKNAGKWKEKVEGQEKVSVENQQKRSGNIADRIEQNKMQKIPKREKICLKTCNTNTLLSAFQKQRLHVSYTRSYEIDETSRFEELVTRRILMIGKGTLYPRQ